MRQYETIVIVDPDISEDQQNSLFGRLEEIISQQGGFLVEFDDWGQRKLAYSIKKKVRGHYVRLDYCGAEVTVSEIERFCRIDDRLMKYMTVLLDKTPDVESLKATKEAADALKSQEAEAKAAATSEIVKPETEAETEAEETSEEASTDSNPEEEE